MEWVARRAAEDEAAEATKVAAAAAIVKAQAAKVALREEAVAMFEGSGNENSPFSYVVDTTTGEKINHKFRGYKGQGEIQSVTFSNDSTFTIRNWSDKKEDEYECTISGWYLCKNDTGDITGRVDDVIFTGLPNSKVVPNVGDFIEGNHQATLNKLDPNKFSVTFVAARGRTRSRGGSGGRF